MATPEERFKQSITYAAITARDTHGKPTAGSQSTARARVQPSSEVVKDPSGEERAATHVVYTAATLTTAHRVWLPGADTSDFNAARRPISVSAAVDGEGVTRFWKVLF